MLDSKLSVTVISRLLVCRFSEGIHSSSPTAQLSGRGLATTQAVDFLAVQPY